MKKLLLAATALLLAAGASAQPKVIAHRGYWQAPGSAQNSLTSLAKADSIGSYGSEFDVWLTADNKLIVNHDRTYGGTDIRMDAAPAKRITAIVLPNGERIPTLDAYLSVAEKCPATRLILEMKVLADPKREMLCARKIVRALKRHGVLDRTDFISFSFSGCLAFRSLLPDARVYYLTGDRTPKQIAEANLTGIDYWEGVLREHPEWIAEAHALGLEVNVWTVDEEENMRHFIAEGVDYITTDRPEQLQTLLGR